ncbi:MAG: hypothetical protein QXN71_01235 [Candidatus Aenigmatarchaeota archaeon]
MEEKPVEQVVIGRFFRRLKRIFCSIKNEILRRKNRNPLWKFY